MKTKNKIIYSFLVLQFFAISLFCQKFYAVNEGMLLALSEKNDLKISGALGSNAVIGESLSFQAGYSPFKYLAIHANYFSYNYSSVRDVSIKSNSLSGAIGAYYFYQFAKKRSKGANFSDNLELKNGVLLDLYLGHSGENIANFFPNGGSAKVFFSTNFIQGGVHFQLNKFGIDYVFKVGNLHYKAISVGGFYTHPSLLDLGLNIIDEYDLFQFRESSIRLRLQVLYAGLFLSYTRANFPESIDSAFVNNAYHIGLIIDIDDFFKK